MSLYLRHNDVRAVHSNYSYNILLDSLCEKPGLTGIRLKKAM